MMTAEAILKGESKTVEFKRQLPDRSDQYMKSVIAFSNTSGGKLIIGVEDTTRRMIGVPTDKAFEIIDRITNAISDSCTPQIIPDISIQTIQDKTIVVVTIYPGKQRPYYLTSIGKVKGTYIRTAGSSRQADRIQIKELEFEGANRYFDQTYRAGYFVSQEQIDKLCQDMKKWALRGCGTEQENKQVKDITKGNLISWGILTERNGVILPTNGFFLLAENSFPHAKIQCGVFKGTTRNVFIDKREYTGPIQDQIEEAYQFVLRNIRLGATIRGLYRVDDYELPTEGIRELICNAVTHRSYLDEGCIQVALFDDRLEVTSPGMLFGGMSIEDLKEGQSRPRNRAIASAFVAMKIIEQWGTGIPRILKMCKEYGLQEPEFFEMGMAFRVNMFRRKPTEGENKLLFVEEKPLFEGTKPLFHLLKQQILTMEARSEVRENATIVFEIFGIERAFSRKDIRSITGLSESAAGNLIHKLREASLIVPVRGNGKGKYQFSSEL